MLSSIEITDTGYNGGAEERSGVVEASMTIGIVQENVEENKNKKQINKQNMLRLLPGMQPGLNISKLIHSNEIKILQRLIKVRNLLLIYKVVRKNEHHSFEIWHYQHNYA